MVSLQHYHHSESFSSVIQKLDLPLETELHLTDKSKTEVDADVFEELLQTANLTVGVTTEKLTSETRPCGEGVDHQ